MSIHALFCYTAGSAYSGILRVADRLRRQVMENLRDLVHVPSVPMHIVPDKTVGEALGMRSAVRIGVGVDDEDEVDVRIRGEYSPF